jgi:hypothetical protein
VKTTFELPNQLFRQAKATAAEQGVSLRQLFTEAIAEKLAPRPQGTPSKPWMTGFGSFGKTPADRAETGRIQQRVDDEFEHVDLSAWK